MVIIVKMKRVQVSTKQTQSFALLDPNSEWRGGYDNNVNWR